MVRLRWAFLFKSGREVYGGWNSMSPNPSDSPKCVDLTGLGHAVIQSKDAYYQVRTLAALEAEDFIEFQTIALAPMSRIVGYKGRQQLHSHFGGYRLLGKNRAYEVFANGRVKTLGG